MELGQKKALVTLRGIGTRVGQYAAEGQYIVYYTYYIILYINMRRIIRPDNMVGSVRR